MSGYLWLVIAVLFGIIETATAQLTCIWFAGGALCAGIAEFSGADFTFQLVIFATVSAILLVVTRPLVRKITNTSKEKTNSERLIGQTTVLVEAVDSIAQTGKVIFNGIEWSVKSEDESVIEKGTLVEVVRIEGVKLVVKRKD